MEEIGTAEALRVILDTTSVNISESLCISMNHCRGEFTLSIFISIYGIVYIVI